MHLSHSNYNSLYTVINLEKKLNVGLCFIILPALLVVMHYYVWQSTPVVGQMEDIIHADNLKDTIIKIPTYPHKIHFTPANEIREMLLLI